MNFAPRCFLSIFIVFCIQTTWAEELLGVRISAAYWGANTQGRFQSEDLNASDPPVSATRVSVFEAGIDDDNHLFYAFELRHKIPLIPRFVYEQSAVSSHGQFTNSRDINYVDTTFVAGSLINSETDVSYSDISLYYSLLDNWINFDVGLSSRRFDGNIALTDVSPAADSGGDTGGDTGGADGGTGGDAGDGAEGTTASTPVTANIDSSKTLVFSRLGFELPETNITFNHYQKYYNSGEEHFSDREITIGFTNDNSLVSSRVELGYKKTKIISENTDQLSTNIKVGGPFLRFVIGL